MSTITLRELKRKPTRQWLKSAGKNGLIVTDDGQPVAILLRTNATSAKSTLATLRCVRALQAAISFRNDGELEDKILAGLDSGKAAPVTGQRRRRIYSTLKKA